MLEEADVVAPETLEDVLLPFSEGLPDCCEGVSSPESKSEENESSPETISLSETVGAETLEDPLFSSVLHPVIVPVNNAIQSI